MNSRININPFLLVLIFIVFLSIGYLAGCQLNNPSPQYPQGTILNSGPGLENMQSVTDIFLKSWNEGDAVGCASTYSKDAIFMSSGQIAVEGRDAIQEFFVEDTKSVNGAEMKIEEKVQEVIYFDDWAVMRGSGIVKATETDSIEDDFIFKWAMLSKKNQEGKWESVWDILNEDNL